MLSCREILVLWRFGIFRVGDIGGGGWVPDLGDGLRWGLAVRDGDIYRAPFRLQG